MASRRAALSHDRRPGGKTRRRRLRGSPIVTRIAASRMGDGGGSRWWMVARSIAACSLSPAASSRAISAASRSRCLRSWRDVPSAALARIAVDAPEQGPADIDGLSALDAVRGFRTVEDDAIVEHPPHVRRPRWRWRRGRGDRAARRARRGRGGRGDRVALATARSVAMRWAKRLPR
jgi:hypothetical protein